MTVSRRTMIKGVAAGSLALATPMIMTKAVHAKADFLGPTVDTFHRIKFGEMEITVFSDATAVIDGPQPFFAAKQDPAKVAELMAENRLPDNKLAIKFSPTLVNTGKELVLFDTGNGSNSPRNGKLREYLGKAGYTPEQVDVVAITHFHPDHIGGMMTDGASSYPNARYVMPEGEYNFWTKDSLVGTPAERVYKLAKSNVVPFADKTSFIKDGGSVVNGITAVGSNGHTPGHTSYLIESAGKSIMVTGDVANHFVISFQRPEWGFKFDGNPEEAVKSRRKILGMLSSEKMPFIGYHMPFPSVGYVEPMGNAFRYVAQSYQLEL